jgi:Ser/Thr protein kinase RdoA (MazF antagonist)
MRQRNTHNPADAAEQFSSTGSLVEIQEYGSGHVHDTFLVTIEREGNCHAGAAPMNDENQPVRSPFRNGGQGDFQRRERFILQRINTRVFHQPELLMRNMSTVTGHLQRRLQFDSVGGGRRWDVPCVLHAQDGRDCWMDPHGAFWRAMSFIERAESFDTIQDEGHAGEVGYALGTFHSLICDLPMENLADTLPGFHITPLYLRHYDRVVEKKRDRSSPELSCALRFVTERRAFVEVLEEAKSQGKLRLLPIHGDPKVNNVMIDSVTGLAVSLVDLDTVKPGLVLYDIGDCLRSSCNPLGEAVDLWESVPFEADLCRAILRGYLSAAKGLLTRNDCEYLYDAVRLIAFELGLRFLTDYLEGDVYFKVRHREHNLHRALVQFQLTQSIESQEEAIRRIVFDLR